MALVVLLRGVNVGGHRRFRPSEFAGALAKFGVVNIGAAGTFVVWDPGPRAKFRAELLRNLPFTSEVVLCNGRDLIRIATENPFGSEPPSRGTVRFLSTVVKPVRVRPAMPIMFPPEGEWLVRLIGSKGRFMFGEYRRHMKTIGYLGQIDKVLGVKVTTRNWNTIMSVVNILKRGK